MPSALTMVRAHQLYCAHLAGEHADALDKNLPGCAAVFRIEAERAHIRAELLLALDKPAPTV